MEKKLHELISNLAATIPQCEGLTSGYIGNNEPWGDDRELRVWADGKLFWDCRPDQLDENALKDLVQKLNSKYNLNITGCMPETFEDLDCGSGPGM